MADIQIEGFPIRRDTSLFKWAPILFHPISFSPERVIIGVVISSETDAHLIQSNQLKKLECLFGPHAKEAIFAAKVALDAIEVALQERGSASLAEMQMPISGLSIGEAREAEGASWREVAERWYAASSALFAPERQFLQMVGAAKLTVADGTAPQTRDRLPKLVMDYVLEKRPTFNKYFNPKLSNKRGDYAAAVDYAGVHLVASFGTLFASRSVSVNTIKRRMWDLGIEKETEGSMAPRAHEMIVQFPRKNDPQISDRQFSNIAAALKVLEGEADMKEIRLRPMHTIEEIGGHILKVEQAA